MDNLTPLTSSGTIPSLNDSHSAARGHPASHGGRGGRKFVPLRPKTGPKAQPTRPTPASLTPTQQSRNPATASQTEPTTTWAIRAYVNEERAEKARELDSAADPSVAALEFFFDYAPELFEAVDRSSTVGRTNDSIFVFPGILKAKLEDLVRKRSKTHTVAFVSAPYDYSFAMGFVTQSEADPEAISTTIFNNFFAEGGLFEERDGFIPYLGYQIPTYEHLRASCTTSKFGNMLSKHTFTLVFYSRSNMLKTYKALADRRFFLGDSIVPLTEYLTLDQSFIKTNDPDFIALNLTGLPGHSLPPDASDRLLELLRKKLSPSSYPRLYMVVRRVNWKLQYDIGADPVYVVFANSQAAEELLDNPLHTQSLLRFEITIAPPTQASLISGFVEKDRRSSLNRPE